jgi:hypothetical protein
MTAAGHDHLPANRVLSSYIFVATPHACRQTPTTSLPQRCPLRLLPSRQPCWQACDPAPPPLLPALLLPLPLPPPPAAAAPTPAPRHHHPPTHLMILPVPTLTTNPQSILPPPAAHLLTQPRPLQRMIRPNGSGSSRWMKPGSGWQLRCATGYHA